MTLGELLGHLSSPSDTDKLYLYQCPLSGLPSKLAPLLTPTLNRPSSCSLWLSGDDALTPMHYDTSPNIIVQLFGAKEVIVSPPTEFAKLYPYNADHTIHATHRFGIWATMTTLSTPRFARL